MYADPALDHKPELLAQRGGAFYSEAAVALLVVAARRRPGRQVVNLRNNGTLPFLDDDAVIEVPARIGRDGPVPCRSRRWRRCCAAWSRTCRPTRNSRSTPRCAAAGTGWPRRCSRTRWSGSTTLAEALADRLLAENARFLSWALASCPAWLMP